MIKIAFVINFSKNSWTGGYNFFENLIFFIKKYKKKINISIITDNKKNFSLNKNLKNVEILETDLVSNRFNLKRTLDKVLILLFGKSFFFENYLLNNNIKILSHSISCGKNSKIKSFPWFPDFQHIHFPENFTLRNKLFRNLNVLLSSKNSNKIILSSKSVKNDIKKISETAFQKSEILYHTNRVISFKNIHSLKYLKKKFKIKKKFFLLPNHYWIHKNHIVVLKALKKIKNPNFEIVSTGMLLDHRDRNYIKKIQNFIIENNLIESYRILDLVSFKDLCILMRHSIAVINPSFSEGWGNSADQARILGKPCILSRIPAHTELKYKYTYYFNPNNYLELSKLLVKCEKKKFKIKKLNNNKEAEKKYVDNYLKIISN